MLKRPRISQRVGLALFIPLIELAIFGAMKSWNSYAAYTPSHLLNDIFETMNELGAVSHTLQTERGLSAGHPG